MPVRTNDAEGIRKQRSDGNTYEHGAVDPTYRLLMTNFCIDQHELSLPIHKLRLSSSVQSLMYAPAKTIMSA